jgi:hypothetical protein
MARKQVDRRPAVERIYKRIDAARITAKELCDSVQMNQVTLSRGRSTGQIGVKALERLEQRLDAIEAGRA